MSSFIHQVAKEIHGYHAICDEYLEGTETTRTPEFLRAYIEEKTDEITQLKEELELKKDAWCPELILEDLYENTNYGANYPAEPAPTIKEYILKIEAENEKLKEERDKLKAIFLDYEDEAFYSMDAVLQQAEDDFKDFHKAEAENEKLKEEIEELTNESVECRVIFDATIDEIAKLREELEEKNGQLYEQDEMYSQIQGLEEEIAKWRTRMKKAEYWASEVIHYSHSASLDNLQAKKLITPDNKPTLAEVRDFGEEITQLKERIDKLILKETQTHNNNVSLMAELEESKVVIDCLKKEIEKFKEDDRKRSGLSKDEVMDTLIDIQKKSEKIDELEEENKRLFKYSQVMGEIDGDTMADLLADCGWEYNDDGELMKKEDRMMTSDSEEEDSDSDDGCSEGDVLMMLAGSPPTPDADEQYA